MSSEFEDFARRQDARPMSRAQSLVLLTASVVIVVAGVAFAPVVSGWVTESRVPHFGKRPVDTMANVGMAIEAVVFTCGLGGLWAAIKGLVRGR